MFLSVQNEVRSFFTNVHFKYQQNLPRKPSRLWANLEMCAQLSITVWNTSLHENFSRRASIKHATWNDHDNNDTSRQINCIYWFIEYIVTDEISLPINSTRPYSKICRYDMTTEKSMKTTFIRFCNFGLRAMIVAFIFCMTHSKLLWVSWWCSWIVLQNLPFVMTYMNKYNYCVFLQHKRVSSCGRFHYFAV